MESHRTRSKRILIAGASGLIGTALAAGLRRDGHSVLKLVRRPARDNNEVEWNPATGDLDPRAIEGVHGVVNLAGENLAAGRWTTARRARIRASRIDATRTLVTAIARLDRKPAVLVNASAVGFYGDRGDAELTEDCAAGEGFLADVCRSWEAAAAPATHAGVRVVVARLGMVLAAQGGALTQLLPLFRLGLGGRISSGAQWMSWIALDDAVHAFEYALADERLAGAVNFTAPQPVTNRDFAAALAAAVRRPAWLPVPAWALQLAFGEMAEATILASTRAVPARLERAGYRFAHPGLRAALTQVATERH